MRLCEFLRHHHRTESILSRLDRIEGALTAMAATLQDFQTALDRIDTATNGIADEIKALKDQIAGAGLDPAAQAALLSSLEAAAAKIEGVQHG